MSNFVPYKGFIKIDRSILNDWVCENGNRFLNWVNLVANANWQDAPRDFRGRTVTIGRGQLYVSYRKLAEMFRCSEKYARNVIRKFFEHGMLDYETVNGMTLITIKNYNKYQEKSNNLKVDGNCTQNSTQSSTRSETFVAKGETQTQYAEKSCKCEENSPQLKEYKEKKENMLPHIKDREEAVPANFDVLKFINFFNTWIECGEQYFQCKIPRLRALTPERIKAIQLLRAQGAEGQQWNELMNRVIRQPFLNGRGKKRFVATFDWLIKPEHFWRSLEGNYNNLT